MPGQRQGLDLTGGRHQAGRNGILDGSQVLAWVQTPAPECPDCTIRRYGARMSEPVSVSLEIDAPAEKVWSMVSDVTRMGEWSPENEGGEWLGDATGPEVGARFRGSNRNGKKTWTTTAKVVAAEPGRIFSFLVDVKGLKVAEWRYTFESTASGCRVEESWIDRRGRIAKLGGKPVSGVDDRASHNRDSMEQTLARLKAAAESTAD